MTSSCSVGRHGAEALRGSGGQQRSDLPKRRPHNGSIENRTTLVTTTRIEEFLRRSHYLTNSCAKASIVVGPWNFSVPELPKWIQPELKLFTISI